jgi:hypothetical protein
MSRRDYNAIFHPQAAKIFAEHDDTMFIKVFYMVRKKSDEIWKDEQTGEESIVTLSVELKSIDYVRGRGIASETIAILDGLYREKEGPNSKIPVFAEPNVYTERELQFLTKSGMIYND